MQVEIQNNTSDLYTGNPIDSNIYKWKATIKGPKDSPYQNGIFHLFVEFLSTIHLNHREFVHHENISL